MRLSSRTTTHTPRRALPNFTTGTSSTAKSFTFPSLRANQRRTARRRRLHTTAVDAEVGEIDTATEAGEAATEAEAAAGTVTGLVHTDAKNAHDKNVMVIIKSTPVHALLKLKKDDCVHV